MKCLRIKYTSAFSSINNLVFSQEHIQATPLLLKFHWFVPQASSTNHDKIIGDKFSSAKTQDMPSIFFEVYIFTKAEGFLQSSFLDFFAGSSKIVLSRRHIPLTMGGALIPDTIFGTIGTFVHLYNHQELYC